MANNVRTVDFLPEIFQTPVNRQFLAATLDQLVQEPKFKKNQGFIGRRIGPGVNANDRYVVESTAVRNNYQLEPGVCQINPENTREVIDAITYPGINDALALQGAVTTNPDALYTSDYYTWDPFVDFDKFINYAQYYWVPDGPDPVAVNATGIPTFENFTVTRNNGFYSFSGVNGSNPTLTLARTGTYNFEVAQNESDTIQYRVSNDGTTAWLLNYDSNPTLTLVRGNTYIFNLSLTLPLPFYIKTELSFGDVNLYNDGVTNNGAVTGIIRFTVPQNAPNTLFYCSSTEFNMRGQFNIVDGTPGTGANFWIQTHPGVAGEIPATPNISSRLNTDNGVTDNGIDLGTITFEVPTATDQDFYYSLPLIGNIPGQQQGTVDLVTGLDFNQIDAVSVDSFFTAYPTGIDGITNLRNRTIIFDTTTDLAAAAGVWLIDYVDVSGTLTIQLTNILAVTALSQLTILFGTQYASTRWYKDADDFFVIMPLLAATLDVLYYQDSTNPVMFGAIQLVDINEDSVLDIANILGKQNYSSPNGVTFTNGMKVLFDGATLPTSYENNEYYVEGVGTAIQLLPVTNFVTPETYLDGSPVYPDYLTVNRASLDRNPWTRSNRWFHVDVLNVTAEYNKTANLLDQEFRARRPILEFRAGTRLFNFGTQGLQAVDIVDFSQTNALRTVNGTIGFSTDGYTLVEGSLVIFAGDTDIEVRNKIYQVEFVSPDTVLPLIEEPIINLLPVATVLFDQDTVSLYGDTVAGISYRFDGVDWLQAQQKTSVNQPPQFDIYDANGISFGDDTVYPSTNFDGSSLFSYALGNGVSDVVLGFPLTYLNLANIGDIVFANNLYADSFNYTTDSQGITVALSTGLVRQYSTRLDFVREIGWQDAITQSQIRQQFRFVYDALPIQLDVAVNDNTVVPAIQIFINAQYVEPYDNATGTYNYTYTTTANTTSITLTKRYVVGNLVEIQVLSDQTSATAFYQVPINLENNPFNGNSSVFTLGTARNHYSTIGQNLIDLQGPVIGANNSRDLGNLIPYGLQILQQGSPLSLTGYFLRSEQYNIFNALQYNSREYIKFKSLLLNTAITNDFVNLTVPEILDRSVAIINAGDTSISPFYWSDMMPTGSVFVSNSTTVNPITTARFNTVQTYDFTSANYLGLVVYINDVTLTRGVDYVVGDATPTLTILVPLTVGDVVTINEYNDTAGNFVPNTPTKLGLYPKFVPRIYLDNNYVRPTLVIQGHDGSRTIAFGDIRDQVLLEFEKRIYSNLKTDDNPVPLTVEQVLPGFFRTTDYTEADITRILGEDFLIWAGLNKLDYTTQDYLASNPFTYNYSTAGNRINNEVLSQGAWRGIYRYFYDTMSPDTTPWEMLGFSEQPIWWEDRYGPAPYTRDNLVLWGDLEQGLVFDPVLPYVKPNFARPGLTLAIPVDSLGQLLPPLESVVGLYNPNNFRKSWAVGDGGPVEASWWMSSSYPFAVMRLLALTRPAEFFSLFADRDLYRYNAELDQYLYNNRYRLDGNGLEIYGNGVSKASYINWIVDYNQQQGLNSTDALTTDLANLDVRLCYRVGAWTNQQYLEVYLEKSSPESENQSLQIPPESYNLLVYKDQPFAQISYSAVVVETTSTGWAVYGYGTYQPYFPIVVSSANGLTQTISAGGATVTVPAQYTNTVAFIPYGYVFTNRTMMVDFLLSYGKYLESQGMSFSQIENGYVLNWPQMAQEFLYFSQQGWQTGTLVNLNPAASQLTALRVGSVVDSIYSYSPENVLLDQNRQTFATRDLIIQRDGDSFQINPAPTTNQAISFLNLRFTDYENIIIFDNVDIFNDLIYDPVTGARQNRLYLNAVNTVDWNGTLDAQGFILNNDNVLAWNPNQRYTKGEIVRYKNNYWQASGLVQPKTKFDYNDWFKSNWARIEQGLLPNIANKADQLANAYNTQTANLNNNNDLLAYNLIGFTPRQYMSDLNLDDVSQVNLYQQFIKTKGTTRATDLFTRVNLTKESGDYKIYETWGVLVGTYGANANRSYFELNLNEAKLTSNPSTVQVIEPGQISQANQTILLSNLWRESYRITSTDILPTIYPTNLDTALPWAGYVNINDADITVYSLDDPSSIAANIDIVGNGTSIWVAHDNSYSWNIYRCTQVPGRLIQITDNLNGTSIAQFSSITGLVIGDLVIVRLFANGVDGVYRVLGTPSPTQVIISYSFVNSNQTILTGTGLTWFLQTMRVTQASDVASLPYANQLIPGARAWVDNDGSGHWEVLEKQDPFVIVENKNASIPQSNSLYGASVAQSTNQYSLLVGSPDASSGDGAVYTYRRVTSSNNAGTYVDNTIISLPVEAVQGFGNSLTWGDSNWAVVGANTSGSDAGYAATLYQVPGSNDYVITQLLTAPTTLDPVQFGTAMAISHTERWMYISAPVDNLVYAYGKVDVPAQSVTYFTDGITNAFDWSPALTIDPANPDQLIVTVNNQIAPYPADYIVTGNQVRFFVTPVPGVDLVITRRTQVGLTGTGGANYNLEPYLYTAINIDSFIIQVDNVLQRPYIDYNFTTQVEFEPGREPAVNASIVVITGPYWQYIDVIPTGGLSLSANAVFGASLSTSNDGRSLIVGCELDNAVNSSGNTVSTAGSIYVFDRSVVRYLVTDTAQTTYLIPGSFADPVAVLLNNEFLTNTAQYGNINGQFTISGSNVVLSSSVALSIGDSLEIETNQFQLVQKIVSQEPQDGALFGHAVQICSNDCSAYIGAPHNTADLLNQSGSVERQINQSQLYGVIASVIANPALTAGSSIRINTVEVVVPNSPRNTVAGLAEAISPLAWSSTRTYYANERVIYNSVYYIANSANTGATPSATSIFWDISFAIPNLQASATNNLQFTGNGITQIFSVGSIYTTAGSVPTVYVNGVLQVASPTGGYTYTYNNTDQQIEFVTAPVDGALIVAVSGRLILTVINAVAAPEFNKLSVLPGVSATGSAFDVLGFDSFVYAQTLYSPNPLAYAFFGTAVAVNNNGLNVVVGAPNGNVYEYMPFDGGETIFDDDSTIFNNPVANSGVAYTFDYLPSSGTTVAHPGQFVFGQQIYQTDLTTGDQFGAAVDYVNGRLIVGAPGVDLGESATTNYGSISIFDNPGNTPSWVAIHQQQPAVNIELMNSVYTFDKLLSNTQTYFDFIDPLQGKILGVAARNIDYTGAVDPANYNTGTIHNNGTSWGSTHLGEIWWDTDTVRFIDPNQDNITYASKRWGQIFPGSRVDIYQWIESSVPPANYVGAGTPLSTTSYTVSSSLTTSGVFATYYYYWVRGISTIDTANGKNLSTTAIASYITNPIGSGIPYIAPINSSTVALYNATGLISAQDTILHVEYEQQVTGASANIHTEYQFIADGRPNSFLNDSIYQKMLDSFCGADQAGNSVPDPFLSPGMRYGVQFRPRQSMFINRFSALENYLTRANSILAQFPITETRSFNLLNSSEPVPVATTATGTLSTVSGNVLTVAGTVTGVFAVGQTVTGTGIPALVTILELGTGTGGAGTYIISTSLTLGARSITGTTGYNQTVDNLTVLGYQNLFQVNLGYRYLVLTNSDQDGRWTINEVVNGDTVGQRTTQIVQIQNYDTTLYWNLINWYLPGYNSSIQPIAQVANTSALQTLSITTAPIGSSVKVTNNGQGKFEIYIRTATGWDRVGLEDGTIAFDEVLWNYTLGPYGYDAEVFDAQYFDQEPTIETRKIIQAINQELFIDDLLIYRNQLLILTFKFIYSEFTSPDWLIKTSFIDVDHNLRALLPYQLYLRDNQTFVEQYLQEVKPFHVQTLAFNLIYNGLDLYPGQLTDFDVPAYWNNTLEIPQFVSPVLTPYTDSGSYTESFISDAEPNAAIWAEKPWNYWFNNYTLGVTDVIVLDGGADYATLPTVTFGTLWEPSTVYTVGQQLNYINGAMNNLYTVTVAGTSGTVPPLFTSGSVVNGTTTMTYAGTGAAGYATLAHTIGNVAVTGTAGQFSCDADTLAVGTIVVISGTLTGTATISTYPATTTYYVIATNTATTFTLSATADGTGITTTAGTTTGLTFQVFGYDQVVDVTITDPGTGYVTTTSVTFTSDSGTGAAAYPVMTNSLVRNFSITLKFDRYQYATTIFEWVPGDSYVSGDQVRYRNVVWEANQSVSSTIFDPSEWDLVDASTLTGVDRTMGYYTPTPNMPGLSLPLLIDGVNYPGVQVSAPTYDQDSGFDVGGFSSNPFDNVFFGPEGRPTYDPGILDVAIQSSYLGSYLGTSATDIDVDGGGYIDVFSSYAPEELVPGSEFDTLDFRVFTTGGPTDGLDFRIFQDMQQLQATYVITQATTTELAQDVSASADIIYVNDATALTEPNPAINQWGVITIDAERIMYREIDYGANTVSSLIRGTAGTAATAHTVEVLANVSITGNISNVAVTGTAGQFSCTSNQENILVVGTAVLVTGTLTGTATISTYPATTTYYVIATNGTTTFTLSATAGGSAIVTTAGTTTGLTFQISGQFTCSATTDPLVAGQLLIISGTNIGTGSITGYSSPTTYRISQTTEPIEPSNNTTFVLTNTDGTLVITTAGTPFGLTYDRTSAVYNASAGNLLGQQFQNYIVQDSELADGSTTVFTAPNITLSTSTTAWTNSVTYNAGDIVDDSGSFYRAIQNVPVSTDITDTEYWQPLDVAVEVYVGGIRLSSDFYTVTAQAPVSITLDTAPDSGVDVTILIRRGTWVFYA